MVYKEIHHVFLPEFFSSHQFIIIINQSCAHQILCADGSAFIILDANALSFVLILKKKKNVRSAIFYIYLCTATAPQPKGPCDARRAYLSIINKSVKRACGARSLARNRAISPHNFHLRISRARVRE